MLDDENGDRVAKWACLPCSRLGFSDGILAWNLKRVAALATLAWSSLILLSPVLGIGPRVIQVKPSFKPKVV